LRKIKFFLLALKWFGFKAFMGVVLEIVRQIFGGLSFWRFKVAFTIDKKFKDDTCGV
jgi:hypothetical protein